MRYFERYVPNFYETSKYHDKMLDCLGIEHPWHGRFNITVNLLTMPIAFDTALLTNIYQSLIGNPVTSMFGYINKKSPMLYGSIVQNGGYIP